MKDERLMKSSENSRSTSRIVSAPVRHFSFLDRSHSVFSRNHYYNDLLSKHPWSRRPRSRHSGIAFPALCDTPCSARMDDLARPKLRRESHIRQEVLDNYFNYAYSGVPPAALAAECPPSLAALARPRDPSATTKKNGATYPQHDSGNAAPAQPSANTKKNGSKNPQNAPGNAAPAQPSATTKKNGSKNPKNASENAAPAQPSNDTNAPAKSRRK